MPQTASTMLELGTEAPDFRLPDTSGKSVSLDDVRGPDGFLVMFICNHCPFVKHIRHGLSEFAKEYTDKGLRIVGINSNDIGESPGDSPDLMKEEVAAIGYVFPYLFDETQAVAKSYRAACTPDFFLFDGNGRLVYRGQFDGSRPGNEVAVTGEDLRRAADAVLAGQPVGGDQTPSLGCNIKWREGNAPDYFG